MTTFEKQVAEAHELAKKVAEIKKRLGDRAIYSLPVICR